MEKPKALSEDELKALAQAELRQAIGFYGGKLAEQRRKAEYFYYAEAVGELAPPEIEGRSSVVVPRVRNTILSILPPLMMKFAGGDKVVEFEPTKPGDEKAAQQATDFANWVFFRQNNGHAICRAWFTDALKFKNGIIKVWWDAREDQTREEYEGLTQVELAQVMDDEEVEITEQKSYPDEEDAEQRQDAIKQLTQQCQQAEQAAQQGNQQAAQACQAMQAQIAHIQSQPPAMLYDIVCKRTKKGGKITIENVPPEEFGISRNAKTISDARFVRHSVQRTISELRSMGYDEANIQEIGDDETSMSFNMERVERLQYDDEYAASGTGMEVSDPSQRKVWVHECYMRVDFDGDGIAELRKVTIAGNSVLDNEVVDLAPFVSICPIPEPHKFFGLSIADLTFDGMKTETALLRSILDNTYLEVNGRYFAVQGQVNLDDLLMSRPGGVVRTKAAGVVGRLDQGKGNIQEAMQMLSYMDSYNEDATGYSKVSQSFDTEALDGSETATKTRIVSNKASMRTDDIARNFGEGFVELFRQILKLSSQHQKKSVSIQLSGSWVDVNPREWRNQFDVSINVGLGVGDKDQQISHLSLLQQVQAHGMAVGIATPINLYESSLELSKAIGYRSGDRFFTKPDPNQPPPNPMQGEIQKAQIEAQADMQIAQAQAQMKAQSEAADRQHQAQVEALKAQMQAEVDRNRQASEAQQHAMKIQQEAQLAAMEQQYKDQQHQRDAETEERVALIKARAQIISSRIAAKEDESDIELSAEGDLMGQSQSKADLLLQGQQQIGEHMNNLAGAVHALAQAHARPKQIMRDGSGRATGIQ